MAADRNGVSTKEQQIQWRQSSTNPRGILNIFGSRHFYTPLISVVDVIQTHATCDINTWTYVLNNSWNTDLFCIQNDTVICIFQGYLRNYSSAKGQRCSSLMFQSDAFTMNSLFSQELKATHKPVSLHSCPFFSLTGIASLFTCNNVIAHWNNCRSDIQRCASYERKQGYKQTI